VSDSLQPTTQSGTLGRGRRSWGLGGLENMYEGSEYVLTPSLQRITFFHSKLLLDNSASFTSSSMKDLRQKLKVKLIFSRRLNSLLALRDWTWPPEFTTDLRQWTGASYVC